MREEKKAAQYFVCTDVQLCGSLTFWREKNNIMQLPISQKKHVIQLSNLITRQQHTAGNSGTQVKVKPFKSSDLMLNI